MHFGANLVADETVAFLPASRSAVRSRCAPTLGSWAGSEIDWQDSTAETSRRFERLVKHWAQTCSRGNSPADH